MSQKEKSTQPAPGTIPGSAARFVEDRWLLRLAVSTLVVGVCSLVVLKLVRPDGTAVFWPPNGVLLALMITAPRKRWASYLAGGFLANMATHLITGYTMASTMGLSTANTVEILVAAWPFHALAPQRPDLTQMRVLGRFALFGGFLGPAASGLVSIYLTGHFMDFYSAPVKYRLWTMDDALGMMIFAPLTLALMNPEVASLFWRRRLAETVALLSLVTTTSIFAFRQREFSCPFLVVVVLIPVVFRLGLPGAAIGVLLVAIPAVAYTQVGMGPLAVVSRLYWSMLLQAYFLILLTTVYVLAAVLAKEKRLTKELRESETRYRVLAETSQDLILRTSMEGVRTYVSPSLTHVTGWTEEELPPPGSIHQLIHPSDVAVFSAFLEELRREPGRRSLVFRVRKRGGEYAWLEAYVGAVFDHDNVPLELVWTIRDISLRVEHEENLKSQMQWAHTLASTDSLTSLTNRRAFDEALEAEWSRCAENGDSLAVLMMDVDEFKLYNDSHGHQSGDDCLREIGNVIHDCIRQPGDVASRYGGEEFAVILPRANIRRAQDVADRIRERVEALQIEHSSSAAGVVTVSAGVASVYPQRNGLAPAALVDLADQRLYSAKRAGRNRVVETGSGIKNWSSS